MAETRWTPGPWHVEEESDEHQIYSLEIYAGARLIGEVRPALDGALGNARLFAAAPDPYATLRYLVDGGWIKGESGGIGDVQAALAKARGE